MKLPTSGAHDALARVVRIRARSYDIVRPTQDSTARFGETASDTTTISGVSLWLHEPQEITLDTEFGDRVGGDLQGLALPDADVQVNDLVDHGADTYEVDRIHHLPDNEDKVLKVLTLTRRTNDGDA